MHQEINKRPRDTFGKIDLVCYSHLRWGFVFQRPQHLMSRFAKQRRVFFIEEPIFEGEAALMRASQCPKTGVNVVVPVLPAALDKSAVPSALRDLLPRFFRERRITSHIAWFYTPMALEFCAGIRPELTVYDCMDELSLFKDAPAQLLQLEEALLKQAALVFTGGVSLFEAKCCRHNHVHAFPSSVDVDHFAQARCISECPEDERALPHPRIGYAGVIDERMDLDLIRETAALRPGWQIVMLGPVVKISAGSLPRAANIHYLGMKPYEDLPAYFSGWDVALLPFALNDSTRFISPTKTPEYLAAGLPVVSTPIRDVARLYGDLGLARIASTAREFVDAIGEALTYGMSHKWRQRADAFLSTLSWDETWRSMNNLILDAIADRKGAAQGESGLASTSKARQPELAHV